MNAILKEIRNVLFKGLMIMILRGSPQYPSHLRPKESRPCRMRIVLGLGVLMMNAVRRHPFIGRVLDGHRAEDRQEILKRLWNGKAAMRQQTMPPEPDPKPADNPIEHEQYREVCPTKGEERRYSKQVKGNDDRKILVIQVLDRRYR